MPVLAVCDECYAEYRLKDEFGGKKLKCKRCGAVLLVPFAEEGDDEPILREVGGPFDYDRFFIQQKKIAISEKYYVRDEEDNPILFVERPAHFWRSVGAALAGIFIAVVGVLVSVIAAAALEGKEAQAVAAVVAIVGVVGSLIAAFAVIIWLIPKRHISIYTDDTKSHLLLEVFQDQKISFIRATYTIRDPKQGLLGQLRKNYLYNFFRKRWDGYHPDGSPMIVAREDSMILSLLRRLLGPMLGLLRTNFVLQRPGSEVVIGEFNRKLTLFDSYVLDLTADRQRELDHRVAVALGILLDTGEHR